MHTHTHLNHRDTIVETQERGFGQFNNAVILQELAAVEREVVQFVGDCVAHNVIVHVVISPVIKEAPKGTSLSNGNRKRESGGWFCKQRTMA